MSGILESIGQFISFAILQMGAFLGCFTAEQAGETAGTYVKTNGSIVLTIFVIAIPLVGLGIGLLRRLIKSRG